MEATAASLAIDEEIEPEANVPIAEDEFVGIILVFDETREVDDSEVLDAMAAAPALKYA